MVIEIESTDEGRSLEEIVDDLSDFVVNRRLDRERLRSLLVEFAEEIKRQAIEP